MAVARTLSSLEIYDILANLLPGLMLLIILGVTVPVEDYKVGVPSSVLVAGLIVVGFVIGHVVQAIASKLNGPPRLFGLLLSEMRDIEPYDPEGTFSSWNPTIREFFGFKRATFDDLNITQVEEDFWPMAKFHFGLSEDFRNHGRLMQLVLSYLETVPATRALRFQAIHTFHRSMWGMWILSLLLVALIGVGRCLDIIPSRSFPVILAAGMVSLLGIWVFGKRKEKFNKKVVEYAVVDFYVQQRSQ